MTSVSVYYLVLLIPLINAAWFRCDYSYIPYEGWFKLHWEPTDHNTAKRVCLREGAQLVLPLTKELRIVTSSLLKNTAVSATHIDYEAEGQGNEVRREILNSTLSKEIYPIDKKNSIWVFTKSDFFEIKPALAKIQFICHKKAGTAEELNECGTTDNEYTFDVRMGNCYKLHRIRNTWSRAQEICINEGANLAVINSENEAQAIRDVISSNIDDFVPQRTYTIRDLAFVGIKTKKPDLIWQTVDGYTLSMSGYERWGSEERIKSYGSELCGTVNRNGVLYDNPCNQEFPFICEKKMPDCNDRYTPDYRTENCYKFYSSRVTYDQARESCMFDGANLAVINSEGDARAIGDIFNRNPSYSILGDKVRYMAYLGKYKKVPDYFRTVDGDSLSMSGYAKWAPGQLQEAVLNQKCTTVQRNGMLHANQCLQPFPFICEKTNQDCDGYTLDNRTGNCYKFHRIVNAWSGAFETCTIEGGNLAVINSETEAQVIRDLFSRNPSDSISPGFRDSAFLGLRTNGYSVSGTVWEWKAVDGTSLWKHSSTTGYGKWAPGEPNNAHDDEDCITVRRNGLLSDDPCDRRFPFICEKKNEDCL